MPKDPDSNSIVEPLGLTDPKNPTRVVLQNEPRKTKKQPDKKLFL